MSRNARVHQLTILLVIIVLAAVLLSGPARSSEGRFRINELKLKGEVTNIVVADVDGDGLNDLVVFHADATLHTPRRWVTVLWQDPVQGFASGRSYDLEPERDVAAMDVGQVDGKQGLDLVAICPSGIVFWPNQGRDFGPRAVLVKKDTALALASPRTLPYVDFVQDWNGDGIDDLLLFQFDLSLLYPGTKEGIDLSTPRELAIKPWGDVLAASGVKGDAANQQDLVSMNLYLPRVYARDWDGDGRMDLVAVRRKDIHVFLQAPDGTYPESGQKEYEVELFSPKEENFSAQPYYPYYPPSIGFADVDHDGKTDVIAQQLTGLLGKMKSKVVLYWGRTGSLAAGKPDVVFTPQNLGIMALTSDVNHDGLLDMVIPTLGLSLFSVGRVFVTGTFPVDINYYLQAKDHTFPKEPSYVHTLNLVFDLQKFRLAAGVPGVFGDFNGDGYPDDAISTSKNELEVSINDAAGNRTGVKETVSIPVSSMIIVQDLNGDHKSDIILNYFDDPDHRGEIRVLMNKGNW